MYRIKNSVALEKRKYAGGLKKKFDIQVLQEIWTWRSPVWKDLHTYTKPHFDSDKKNFFVMDFRKQESLVCVMEYGLI